MPPGCAARKAVRNREACSAPRIRYFVALREELFEMGVAGKRIRTDLAS